LTGTKKKQPLAQRPSLTMADLAELAGVSKITVSRALSESPLVNADTRERVQALAR
jgi:DNA-binding LacI/PurR family transcriptional regulator